MGRHTQATKQSGEVPPGIFKNPPRVNRASLPSRLAQFPDILVPGRNTTFQFKGQAADIPAIAEKLDKSGDKSGDSLLFVTETRRKK
jgi:hypothetical protein